MKTKQFNKVKPYTYLIIRKSDNMKYHGVRYGNIKLGLSPKEDFGKKYFGSSAGSFCGEFMRRLKIPCAGSPNLYDFGCWPAR